MTTKTFDPLVVLPRVLAIAVAIFLGMFALDAFGKGAPLFQSIGEFVVHLIPSAIVLAIVVAAWRRPLIGALAYFGLASLYAWIAPVGRLDWMMAISAPLALVGAGFLGSWLRQRRVRTIV
jgi:hypothetical protein